MHFSAFAIETAITNLGDSAVLMTLVLIAAPYLFLCGQKREAALIVLASGCTSALMAVLKMVVLVCYLKSPFPGLISPSGHTALTTLVYGALALMLFRASTGWPRWAGIAAFCALVPGVAVTRVLLGYHSRSEVVAGFLVGEAMLAAFAILLWRKPPSANRARLQFHPGVLAGLTLAVVVLMSGNRLPAEKTIDRLAWVLNEHIGLCR